MEKSFQEISEAIPNMSIPPRYNVEYEPMEWSPEVPEAVEYEPIKWAPAIFVKDADVRESKDQTFPQVVEYEPMDWEPEYEPIQWAPAIFVVKDADVRDSTDRSYEMMDWTPEYPPIHWAPATFVY